MNWNAHYESRQIGMDEAAAPVRSGDRVVAAHACGSPEPVLEALVKRAREFRKMQPCPFSMIKKIWAFTRRWYQTV